jgi:hypothetical protein
MTWFSLPATQTEKKAAFVDASSATRWLAEQPQANASAMLAELVTQIQLFNSYSVAPRERFKTIELLRKTLFAVSGECQRRYENKPLPLPPAEQSLLDSVRRLWRACLVSYLHCLRAALDFDASIIDLRAKLAHRASSCLRMEQMHSYLAGAELDGVFWRNLHAILASAEQLDVACEPVSDRLLGETSESTVSGQYSMMVLLHLAQPFSLSRAQFSATIRWFARWREQVDLLGAPNTDPKSHLVAIDLSQDKPIHDNFRAVSVGRWLVLDSVLRKMRQRLKLLREGESPESLKLGSGLSDEACIMLMTTLSDRLKYPAQPLPEANTASLPVLVASRLENIHRLLGGSGLKDPTSGAIFGNTLSQQQIAVFDHVVRETADSRESTTETWQLLKKDAGEWQLLRPTGNGETRLVLKGLLAARLASQGEYALATISSLYVRGDGGLSVGVNFLPGEPAPLVAEVREKPSGKISRHPAFLLPADIDMSPSVILPVGLAVRALSIRFYEARTQSPLSLRLLELMERSGDNERWSLATDR